MTPRARLWGTLLIVGSSAAYSLAGFYTRLIPLDIWTLLFWRGLFAGGFIAAWVVAREGRRSFRLLRGMGRPGLVIVGCSALGTVMFINALRRTSVAEVVTILATLPFLTAGIGRLAFGMRESRATMAASAVALAGVTLMVGGAGLSARVAGEVLAFGATLMSAILMLTVQRHREVTMLPAAAVSVFLPALLAAPMAAPFAVTFRELAELALFGVSQLGLGLMLLTLGVRLVSATEAALTGTVEVPMAALWVWLAFGETPRWTTVAGGAVVIAAVLLHAGQSLVTAPAPAGVAPPETR